MENKITYIFAAGYSMSLVLLMFSARMTLIATSAGIYGLSDIYAGAVKLVTYTSLFAVALIWIPRTRHLALLLAGLSGGFYISPICDFYQKLMSFTEKGDFTILHLTLGGWLLLAAQVFLIAAIVTQALARPRKL